MPCARARAPRIIHIAAVVCVYLYIRPTDARFVYISTLGACCALSFFLILRYSEEGQTKIQKKGQRKRRTYTQTPRCGGRKPVFSAASAWRRCSCRPVRPPVRIYKLIRTQTHAYISRTHVPTHNTHTLRCTCIVYFLFHSSFPLYLRVSVSLLALSLFLSLFVPRSPRNARAGLVYAPLRLLSRSWPADAVAAPAMTYEPWFYLAHAGWDNSCLAGRPVAREKEREKEKSASFARSLSVEFFQSLPFSLFVRVGILTYTSTLYLYTEDWRRKKSGDRTRENGVSLLVCSDFLFSSSAYIASMHQKRGKESKRTFIVRPSV